MQQRDNLDLARVLLARAIDDAGLVRKVLTDTDIADAIVGFHCQQAVEKLVKAVLTAHGMAFAKSHDMEYLIDLVAQGGIDSPEGIRDAEALSPWAVEFRYEGEEPPVLDRADSLALVERLQSWAESEIETASQQQVEPEAGDDERRQPEQS
jgi:HEPN domain-containing protein